jgi:cobalt-precorrin-7 (C5)-methyltransferase
MKIVGVGAAPGLLTEEAIKAIRAAKMIYGSKRAIEIASHYIKDGTETHEIDFKEMKRIPEEAVVLSTGDPMLSGLGVLEGEVIPGISSLQLACARLKIDLTSLSIITAHGRDIEKSKELIIDEIKSKGGKKIFILPDPKFGAPEIGEFLYDAGHDLPMAILENLGYENERILIGKTSNPPTADSNLYVIVVGEDLSSD